MIIRNVDSHDLPLCPNKILGPPSPLHAEEVRNANLIYEALPKDEEDGDLTPEADKLQEEMRSRAHERMQLYHQTTGFFRGSRRIVVESYFYKCLICGLILPAHQQESR